MAEKKNVLLIYIPCHNDFDAAVNQAKKVKLEFLNYTKLVERHIAKIEIIISVNNYTPSKNQIDLANRYVDQVILNSNLFLADANIANGFIIANQRRCDFLWLLSANDVLLNNGVTKMLDNISSTKDLVVAAVPDANPITVLKQVINPPVKGYAFGLISGVIYNCQTLSQFFNTAQFFIWTGWSQLSVIQNALDQKGSLNINTVNIYDIYVQRQTKPTELRNKYGHSFFGYILLGSIFAKSIRDRNQFIKQYVFNNAFKISLYKRSNIMSVNVLNPESYLIWNQYLAESVIKKSSLIIYFFYKIMSCFPFWTYKRKYNYAKEML